MQSDRYFATDSPEDFERKRLALLTQLADPITIRRLTELGVGLGWRCLEVGAGDGSIARWLAERVGPTGHVVATDLNPRFFNRLDLPNLEVRRHNILEDDLEPGHYDLVHCRFVLQHLPEPPLGLKRLADAVRPGGCLLDEELDAGFFVASDPSPPRAAAFNRRSQTFWANLKAHGHIDPAFGRRLPDVAQAIGLHNVGHEGVTLMGRGGDPMARFLQMTGAILRERFIAAGVLTAEDFDELDHDYDDPAFWFVGFTDFGVWGRRAG